MVNGRYYPVFGFEMSEFKGSALRVRPRIRFILARVRRYASAGRGAHPSSFHPIPLLQHESPRPKLPIRLDLLLLQHAERLPRKIRAIHLLRIEHVPQLIPTQPVQPRIIRVEFRPQVRASILVPLERLAVIGRSLATYLIVALTQASIAVSKVLPVNTRIPLKMLLPVF